MSRILGRRGFWSFDLEISPAVLDPRADTEALVDAALNALHARRGEALRVLDFGTGSGAILAALLSELPNATGVGIDVSEAAAAQARGNFAALGLARRAQFVVSDWGASLGGETFDLIVSNPPYIPSEAIATLDVGVRAHDPILALDGGADGFDAFRKLAPQVARLLAADGWFFFEMGQGQGDTLWAMLGVAGLAPTTRFCDLSGIARGIGGRRA